MSCTDRFDPLPGQPYGKCTDCTAPILTEADSHSHMDETFKSGGHKSHRISVLNASRKDRVGEEVTNLVEDAIYEAVRAIENLVDYGHATEEEITEALSWHSDFADEWQKRIA